MHISLREELVRALGKIDRPGTFCVSGSAPAVLPGLEVDGLGPIGLPLTAGQAKELKARCQQAPHGKGTETVVDTSVRKVWRLEPDRFSLTNPEWGPFLDAMVGEVQRELGLEQQKLQSHLYDLLLYERGSFFLPHRDGEKLDRMVATLVVVLPSIYEGGELIVRHDGQERTIDFREGDANPFRIHYAAFYADCEHEVRPLRKGYRLGLVYNLTLAKGKKGLGAPRDAEHVDRIAAILRDWAADDESEKLVITLDHRYTKDGISWDALKGVDRARARILAEAASRAGCRAFLTLLTFWESGSAEYADGGYGSGYGRRRRYYDDDDEEEEDDEASQYEMEEVFDSSLTAENAIDREGNGLPIGTLSVDEEELLDPETLRNVDPEEEFEGYTGNAGMTLDRWYRHAAILLWPERRHFEVLCDHDSRRAVPVLDQMVARWRRAKGKEAAALKAPCVELAEAILTSWPESRYAEAYRDDEADALPKSLAALDDPGLIRAFLGDVLLRDAAADPGPALLTFCRSHGWSAFRRELLAVMEGTTRETIPRNVRLLERLSLARPKSKEGWAELCRDLADALITAILALDSQRDSPDWRSRGVKRADVLAGLTRALIASGQPEQLGRVVDHALATPKVYPLDSAHVPALEELGPWLKKNLKGPCPPLARWVARCRGQLEELTAEEPQAPRDFRRPAKIPCKCADCAELRRFLDDPAEAEHRFRVAQDRRSHLEQSIRQARADVDPYTESTGRPYTLVCPKNTASYRERLKTYRENLEHLAALRAIEAAIPA